MLSCRYFSEPHDHDHASVHGRDDVLHALSDRADAQHGYALYVPVVCDRVCGPRDYVLRDCAHEQQRGCATHGCDCALHDGDDGHRKYALKLAFLEKYFSSNNKYLYVHVLYRIQPDSVFPTNFLQTPLARRKPSVQHAYARFYQFLYGSELS